MTDENIQTLPYADRQFVVVMPDDIVSKQRNTVAKDSQKSSD